MSRPIDLSVRTNIKEFQKNLDSFSYSQMPFATALLVNSLARRVITAETAALSTALKKNPTPFTQHAFAMKSARKAMPIATVFAKDIQARYLMPSEVGGKQVISKRALLNPKDIQLNAYGNLPRNKLAALKGKSNVFIGSVKGKTGSIGGVWQRVPLVRGSHAEHGRLKLLIRFGEGVNISPHLQYRARAQQIIQKNFAADMQAALDKAKATAKPH